MNDVDRLADGVLRGERRSLAKAITKLESVRRDHAEEGQGLLRKLLPHTGKAVRVGISGTPGVGKSSLIEALGIQLIDAGKRIAVLAVDPSSPLSGGSILGDKTRMERLGQRPEAFIRPSPSQGTLGGVARRTREALLLCEAAGYDVVIVETVGVGQSEVEVARMVDTFVLMIQPASGDALQGVKRGVLELADLVVVHKADGELEMPARLCQQQYELGLGLLRPSLPAWPVPAMLVSSRTGTGLPALWTQILRHRSVLEDTGQLLTRRGQQAERWMWSVLQDELLAQLRSTPGLEEALEVAARAVREGREAPTAAALRLAQMALLPRD